MKVLPSLFGDYLRDRAEVGIERELERRMVAHGERWIVQWSYIKSWLEMRHTIQINRAPMLTLWAVVVADQLGYERNAAQLRRLRCRDGRT